MLGPYRLVAMLMPVTTLTSDPAYPATLFPEPFGPGGGLGEVVS